jgi:hypothetical protein
MVLDNSINIARGILNDTDSTAYRYDTADLLRYGNDAIDQMVTLVPGLFYAEGEMTCLAGSIQGVGYTTSRAIVTIRNVKNGAAILPCSKDSLDKFDPSWQTGATGPAKNWMGVENDPTRFYLYPPQAGGEKLTLLYIKLPKAFLQTEQTGLPDIYEDAVADYIVYRAESRDDEHVISQRAQSFYQSFMNKCSGG